MPIKVDIVDNSSLVRVKPKTSEETIKVDTQNNTSQVDVKPKSPEEIKLGYGCGVTDKAQDARITKEIADRIAADSLLQEQLYKKQDLGFILLDPFFVSVINIGHIPEPLLARLNSYYINKVSLYEQVYYLVAATFDKLTYYCPSPKVELSKIEVDRITGQFTASSVPVSTLDHAQLGNLDYQNSGHTGFAGIEFGTTAHWASRPEYRPAKGMLVVYTDYAQSIDPETGVTIYYPGIKIGDGNVYLADIQFVGDNILAKLDDHIADNVRHITAEERERWNNKLNYDEPTADLLIFNRK